MNAPDWFVKEVQKEFQKLEYGELFKNAADRLWKTLAERGALNP